MGFTQEENLKQSLDKRKLKIPKNRKLKGIATNALIKETAEKTGYQEVAVKAVIEKYLELVKEHLLNKESVEFRGMGTISPFLKKAKKVNSFSPSLRGGDGSVKSIIAPAAFTPKYFPSTIFKNSMKEIPVNINDVENMYL